MAVSLRLLVSFLLISVALITATVVFVPTYISGRDSVFDVAADFRATVSQRLNDGITAFFQGPSATVAAVQLKVARGVMNMSDSVSIAGAMCETTLGTKDHPMVYVGTEQGLWGYCEMDSPTDLFVILRNTTSGYLNYYLADTATAYINLSASVGSSSRLYDPRLRPWYASLNTTVGWSNLYPNGGCPASTVAITGGAPLRDQSGTLLGVYAFDLLTTTLQTFISTMDIGKTGRAFIVETHTRNLLGGNWKGDFVLNGLGGGSSCRLLQLNDTSMVNDTLVRRAVADIGEDTIFTAATPYYRSVGTGLDRYHIEIREITDSLGLNLRSVLLFRDSDFIGEFYRKRDASIGGAVGAVAGLVLLSGFLLWLLLRDLSEIEERMLLSSNLEDSDETETHSSLSEIRNIQTAYYLMRANLRKLKSYLPQSVLAALEAGDDEAIVDVGETSKGGTEMQRKESGRMSMASKASSGRSSIYMSGRGNAVVTRTLNTDTGVKRRRTAILVFNVRGFHQTLSTLEEESQLAYQRNLVELVRKSAASHKGVVDYFEGDHVVVSFGAVSAVMLPAVAACQTALQIRKGLEGLKRPTAVTMGIAVSECTVGNMGSDSMKRFCVIGPAMTQAAVLERMAKMQSSDSCSILVSEAVRTEASHSAYFQAVDAVRLPSAPNTVQCVYAVMGSKEDGEDGVEWMYAMSDAASNDPYQALNDAFTAFVRGRSTDAEQHLQKVQHPEKMHGFAQLQAFLKTPVDEHGMRLGPYFNHAVV